VKRLAKPGPPSTSMALRLATKKTCGCGLRSSRFCQQPAGTVQLPACWSPPNWARRCWSRGYPPLRSAELEGPRPSTASGLSRAHKHLGNRPTVCCAALHKAQIGRVMSGAWALGRGTGWAAPKTSDDQAARVQLAAERSRMDDHIMRRGRGRNHRAASRQTHPAIGGAGVRHGAMTLRSTRIPDSLPAASVPFGEGAFAWDDMDSG